MQNNKISKNKPTSRNKSFLNSGNYKTLEKEIKDNTDGEIYAMFLDQFSCSVLSDSLWLHGLQHARLPCLSPIPGARRINTVKMSIQFKAIYRFSVIFIKLQVALFTEIDLQKSQFVWKHKISQIAKVVLRKKTELEEINLPDFRLYYKATIIKTV